MSVPQSPSEAEAFETRIDHFIVWMSRTAPPDQPLPSRQEAARLLREVDADIAAKRQEGKPDGA